MTENGRFGASLDQYMDTIGTMRKMRKTNGGTPVFILAPASFELGFLAGSRSVELGPEVVGLSSLLALLAFELSSFEGRFDDTVDFFAMICWRKVS